MVVCEVAVEVGVAVNEVKCKAGMNCTIWCYKPAKRGVGLGLSIFVAGFCVETGVVDNFQ